MEVFQTCFSINSGR